jgi:hypothetical protein
MDDGSGGRSQGLLHLHPQKYTRAESGVASPKAFIYKCGGFKFEENFKMCELDDFEAILGNFFLDAYHVDVLKSNFKFKNQN